MARKLKSDRVLFTATFLLVCVSIVMVYSASALVALQRFDQPNLFLTKQALWTALGLAVLAVAMRVDYRAYRNDTFIWSALAFVVLMLVAVLFSAPVNGTRRWFGVGGLGIQPSELAKMTAVLFTALILERRMHRIDDLRYSMLPIGIVVGGLAGLILLQPDFGTAMSLLLIVAAMVFAAGLNYRYLVGTVLAMAPAIYLVLMSADYRRRRLLAFWDPVGGSAGRRLSDHPVAAGGRLRRGFRARADVGRAEAVLPARAAHRLHLRGDRRGARARRRHLHPHLLLRDRLARPAHRVAGAGRLRRVPRARHHHDDRRPGAREHERGARDDADQGHSAAARERRRIVAAHQPARHGHPAEHLAARGVDDCLRPPERSLVE
jgi:hypothetical protein